MSVSVSRFLVEYVVHSVCRCESMCVTGSVSLCVVVSLVVCVFGVCLCAAGCVSVLWLLCVPRVCCSCIRFSGSGDVCVSQCLSRCFWVWWYMLCMAGGVFFSVSEWMRCVSLAG